MARLFRIVAALAAIAPTATSDYLFNNDNTIVGYHNSARYTCWTGLSRGATGYYPDASTSVRTRAVYRKAAQYFHRQAEKQSYNQAKTFRMPDGQKMTVEARLPPDGSPRKVGAIRSHLWRPFFVPTVLDLAPALSLGPTSVDSACCLFQLRLRLGGTWQGTMASTMAPAIPPDIACPPVIADRNPGTDQFPFEVDEGREYEWLPRYQPYEPSGECEPQGDPDEPPPPRYAPPPPPVYHPLPPIPAFHPIEWDPLEPIDPPPRPPLPGEGEPSDDPPAYDQLPEQEQPAVRAVAARRQEGTQGASAKAAGKRDAARRHL